MSFASMGGNTQKSIFMSFSSAISARKGLYILGCTYISKEIIDFAERVIN